ncbi:hypothetical protein M0R45_008891 [Rubus argutus]|uniref:Uncharacterized protein n=1 Tax=Rubus argutus TaxID=59490 RepID=A0AAW1Y6B1_RUBAR
MNQPSQSSISIIHDLTTITSPLPTPQNTKSLAFNRDYQTMNPYLQFLTTSQQPPSPQPKPVLTLTSQSAITNNPISNSNHGILLPAINTQTTKSPKPPGRVSPKPPPDHTHPHSINTLHHREYYPSSTCKITENPTTHNSPTNHSASPYTHRHRAPQLALTTNPCSITISTAPKQTPHQPPSPIAKPSPDFCRQSICRFHLQVLRRR